MLDFKEDDNNHMNIVISVIFRRLIESSTQLVTTVQNEDLLDVSWSAVPRSPRRSIFFV